MKDMADRILRLYPQAKPQKHFEVHSDGKATHLAFWDENALGPAPTEEQLLAVDLTTPTAGESELRAAIQILKNDVPDAWKTSTNAQQRVAWAMKRFFVEAKQELNAFR